jgi:hypothetical protein
VPQRLLQRDRGDLVEVGQFFGLLPRRQQGRGGVVVDPFLPRPRLGTGDEGQVVDLVHASEGARQLGCLRIGRIEAVLERPLHVSGHSSQTSISTRELSG